MPVNPIATRPVGCNHRQGGWECGKHCDHGETLCPRHKFLADHAAQILEAKERAKRMKKQKTK